MRGKSAMLAVLVLLAVAPAAAHALGPAPLARLAFEADGAIYTLDADGSNRTRLTGGSDTAAIEDHNPFWTADGRTVVFERADIAHPNSLWDREPIRSRIWATAASGEGDRLLLHEKKRFDDYLVGVTAEGRIVYLRAGYAHGRYVVLVTAVDPDGTHRKTLLDSHSGEISISPDGERLLYTRHKLDDDYFDHPTLYAMRTDGTHRRRLAKDAGPGTYSPDGKRIAFESVRDRNGTTCAADTCDWNAEIYVMRADGTHRRRLTHDDGDDREPSWSPDGRRIAFDSDRNYQGYGDNFEIYTVGADGNCLTWLTNGSALSRRARWQPGPDPAAPYVCGHTERRPLIEVDLKQIPSYSTFQSYWFGRHGPRGTILDGAGAGRSDGYRWASYWYFDCGEYDPFDCGEPADAINDATCQQVAQANNLPDDLGTSRLELRRGALVALRKESPARVYVFAGTTTITLSGPIEDPDALVDALRRTGESEPSGDLPAPVFPGRMWKRLEDAEDAYARTHDEQAAAEELGIPRTDLRQRLRVAKRLRKLGVDGRARCTKS